MPYAIMAAFMHFQSPGGREERGRLGGDSQLEREEGENRQLGKEREKEEAEGEKMTQQRCKWGKGGENRGSRNPK